MQQFLVIKEEIAPYTRPGCRDFHLIVRKYSVYVELHSCHDECMV